MSLLNISSTRRRCRN